MVLPLPSGDSFVDLLKCFRLKKGESGPVSYRSQRWWWHFEIGQYQKIVNDILKRWGASNLCHTYGWYRHILAIRLISPHTVPFHGFFHFAHLKIRQQIFCKFGRPSRIFWNFSLTVELPPQTSHPHLDSWPPTLYDKNLKKVKLFGWLPLKEYVTAELFSIVKLQPLT